MKKRIKDRYDYIEKYCKGKSVLDIGATSEEIKVELGYDLWLHKRIHAVAKSVEGIDNSKKHILQAKKILKTKIHYADATNFDLKKKYDVIICGEIIEHINNFEGFFNSIKKHMTKKTILILTTPNVFKVANIARILLTGRTYKHPGHIVYFDVHTLGELLDFNELKVVKNYYGTDWAPERLRNIFVRVLGKILPIYNLDLIAIAKLK